MVIRAMFKAVTATRLLPMLLLFALPVAVQAQFLFTTNNDGSLNISGYNGPGGTVIIPDTTNGLPVTTIGTNAFYNTTSLTNITIGNNVTSIEFEAFNSCPNLASVTIPNSVTNIGDDAFNNCTSLISVTIPNGVTSIGKGVFGECTSLISVTIPDSVASIGNAAFIFCSSLTNVTIPDSTTNIGDGAFYGCTSLTSFTIPNSVTSIGSIGNGGGTFQNCTNLISVAIPNSITSIGDQTFYGCTSLTNITIPNSVTSIGQGVFGECVNLTSVAFPNSVTNIGDSLFNQCYRLTSVTLPNGITSIGDYMFVDCYDLTNIIIPDNVTRIGYIAFLYCTNLKSAVIGNSLTTITNSAFFYCPSLTGVYFRGNVPTPTNDASVFSYDTNAIVYYLAGTTGWGTNFDGLPTKLWKPPTISITNMPTGLAVSNAVFTVKGKASDTWQVASVYYSLNSAGWSSAVTTNNWTNWTAAVTLAPGTNKISAYAVDPGGNASPTTNASVFLVVTNQLQVSTVGRGTISPNYSNAWLQIGRNYSVTASPVAGSGFAFANWTGGTSLPLTALTNGPVLQFMMASNLMLQASFVDTNRPTLTFTAPTSGQHMTNALTNVKGTASDNWKVAEVWYQLNSGNWNQPATTNSWTNWTTMVELQNATNTIKAYAVDISGNVSTTNSVSFVSSNAFELQLAFTMGQPLATNGLNLALQISPGLNGHVQVSTNLVDWVTLTNFIGTNSTLNVHDAAATNFNQRFYRAVVP